MSVLSKKKKKWSSLWFNFFLKKYYIYIYMRWVQVTHFLNRLIKVDPTVKKWPSLLQIFLLGSH